MSRDRKAAAGEVSLGGGESKYASHTREVIELINNFRAAGAHFDLDLPTIVFIGDQSTGKSSVLEALSNVQLPRSDGTCTRCPTELRLSQSEGHEPWSCKIRLRWEFDEKTGERLSNVTEVVFGSTITDPNKVSGMVSRAQVALLNPGMDSDAFVTKRMANPVHHKEVGQLGFTRNVCCVDVRGRNVANLTLIDLPGIIRSADREEERKNVRIVEDVIREYIKKNNAIIVCTVSMKQVNQSIYYHDSTG
jgi:GTP-binding protein EngB required for normal cell division